MTHGDPATNRVYLFPQHGRSPFIACASDGDRGRADPQQRAAAVAVLLAQHGEICSPELALAFGMTCQGMNAMLRSLAQVLPIYEPPAGTWLVCHMREED